MSARHLTRALVAGAALTLASVPARAEEITVTHWGALMYGTPYAVALKKGFFKQAGIDITGILTSKGGGTTVRNVLEGGLPFGEVALSAAVAAMQENTDIKIVMMGVRSAADIYWVVKPDSPYKTLKDLVGKKLAITSPKSVTDSLSTMVLNKHGLFDKIERPALGTVGAGLTALDKGAVESASLIDPLYSARKDKYRVIFAIKDELPPIAQTVAIASTKFIKEHPEKLRAIIRGRMMGVDYIYSNPKDAAKLLSETYDKLPLAVAESAVMNNVAIKYWGRGGFEYAAMDEMLKALKIVGALKGEVDWSKFVDASFLPEELKKTN
ncbi:MAG: ABC transporter substrate-binding protein [Candidatus Odyssella sp.]|nr:ABC transporter substrate-binding protein [Candidatus Odyssella sp.]